MMEDNRSNLVVIVVGYTEPMHKFIEANPGLQSRFNKTIRFDDYTPAELAAIFGYFARKANYLLPPQTEAALLAVWERLYAARTANFGNARTVRNVFERTINRQATRIGSAAGMISEEALKTLLPEDIAADAG